MMITSPPRSAPASRCARLTSVSAAVVLLVVSGTLPADAQDGGAEMEQQSDNVTLLEHIPFEVGSDLQFQRREGPHLLDGRTTEGTRDYLFAGADSFAGADRPSDGVGIHVFDVTEPTAIRPVTGVRCLGYHSDVAVFEDLLIQTIEDPASNGGCDPGADPDGIDQEGHEGLRVFDIADPARPRLVRFIAEDELDGGGVHNVTVVPWAGLLYVSTNDLPPLSTGDSGSRFAYVDLTDADLPVTVVPMTQITPDGSDAPSCHDIGLDPDRELAFCAAVQRTFIWDISDPTTPRHVAEIANPAVNIHHGARLAPDGRTLVINDEMGGAIAGFGCLGQGTGGVSGALWFYDVSDPADPGLLGSFATEELDPTKNFCTSHFYNFIPGTDLLVVSWYRSGMIVVDYSDRSAPRQHADLRPAGASFWSAYHWRGFLYGNSFGAAGGLWVVRLDGVGDLPPARQDEGTSWGRWTAPAPDPVAGPAPGLPAPEADDPASPRPVTETLPSTGPVTAAASWGLVLFGLAAATRGRPGR